MDTSTGHLVRDLDQVPDVRRQYYDRIRRGSLLHDEATQLLGARDEVMVDLKGNSKLARWANNKAKARKRAKIAKRSRARNRS